MGLGLFAFRDDTGAQKYFDEQKNKSPDWTKLGSIVEGGERGLPPLLYAHSSSSRLPIRRPERGVELKGRQVAWRGAFDSEAHQFTDLHSWFEQEENLENQEKLRRQSFGFELPSLRALRGALVRFFSRLHGCALHKVSVLRRHSDNPMEPAAGRLYIHKGDSPLFFDQLSDGERRLLSIVLDLARRMVILNPQLPDPTLAEGVLIIDEIELHLHPQWQRTVVGAMVAAFPEMQLIVSTHSPLVLASVKNENIIVLDNGRVLSGTPAFSGRDPNTILNGPMATPLRPDDVQKELDALFQLVDKSPKKAKKPLKALEERLGADDPDLVRARALIELLEG